MKSTFLSAINQRKSIRSYIQFPSEEQQIKIKSLVENPIPKTPFTENSKEVVRLCYIQDSLGFSASCGVISGDKHWICGASKKDDKYSSENYGFVFEWLILECTKLGLGTVWLGGTFRLAPFNDFLKMNATETLLCVSPVGVGEGQTLIGKFFSFTSGSRSRKEWKEMFYEEKYDQPIEKEKCEEKYQNALEAVRLAPSAMNKQPWVIIRIKDGEKFIWNFYRRNYSDYTKIDIGIAMCHWQLACEELSIPGNWEDKSAELNIEVPKDVIYIKSWVE